MGLSSFLRRALPVALGVGAAFAIPGLGAAVGGAFSGVAGGGGLGALIGGFQSSGLGQALGIGIKGLGLFSSFQSNKVAIDQARQANAIQSANTLEAIKFHDIKMRALQAEEASIGSGAIIEDQQLTEQRSRVTRALGFGTATIGREAATVSEQFRQLNEEQERLIGQVAASAASRGVRVSSEQILMQQEEVTKEAEFARGQIALKQFELSQKLVELNQQAEDNIFDTNMTAQIQERNRQMELERIGFEREMNIEREKTARHIAALQGISIPGEGPESESETPEEIEGIATRRREEQARILREDRTIDQRDADKAQRSFYLPGPGNAQLPPVGGIGTILNIAGGGKVNYGGQFVDPNDIRSMDFESFAPRSSGRDEFVQIGEDQIPDVEIDDIDVESYGDLQHGLGD